MSTRPRRTGGSSCQARVAATPPKLSSERVPVLRLTKLEDRVGLNLSTVAMANKSLPARVCLEGLDFVGHCLICLRKLLDTANDSEDEDQDDGDEDSFGKPITPRDIPLKSASRVWQYLHSSFKKNSTTSTPRFTFRMEEVGQDCRGKSRTNKKNRRNAAGSEVANLPPMCRTCYGEVLKLRKLHEELLAIEMTLKSQVDTINKIVEGSTSRRKKFEEANSTSHNNKGKWMDGTMRKSEAVQFLQYIRAESKPSVLTSESEKSPAPAQTEFEGDYVEDDFEMLAEVKEEPDSSSSSSSSSDSDFDINYNDGSLNCDEDASSEEDVLGDSESQIRNRQNAHVRSHTEDKLRPTCDVCGKTFSQRYTLRNHMSTHTGERPYCCEHCGKRFRLPGFLQDHKNNAHRDIYGVKKTFSCELCGKVCYKQALLKQHMLIHSDNRPWVCEVCGKGFRMKRNMKSHWNNIHSKPRLGCNAKNKKPGQIVCLICDMTFTLKSSLADHNKRFHTDWMPYSCEKCNVGFKSKYLLRDHQNIVHITQVSASAEPAERPERPEAEFAATQEDDTLDER